MTDIWKKILAVALVSVMMFTSTIGAFAAEDAEPSGHTSPTYEELKKELEQAQKDLEKAIWRARNIASPLNAKRLGSATPCAVKGDKCYDCDSKGRICKGLQVLWRCPGASGCEYEVVLIDEELGY